MPLRYSPFQLYSVGELSAERYISIFHLFTLSFVIYRSFTLSAHQAVTVCNYSVERDAYSITFLEFLCFSFFFDNSLTDLRHRQNSKAELRECVLLFVYASLDGINSI